MSQIKTILTVAVVLAFLVASGCQSNQFQQNSITDQQSQEEPWSFEGFLAAPISLVFETPENTDAEAPQWCINHQNRACDDELGSRAWIYAR
ncbi:MAG: hypothetical protein JXD22_10245 [Sedimentisphaerales bacterium]|nr:hypothetical protein [Sedimentisphaerales bacterium]